MITKICKVCGEKSINEFYKKDSNKDGLMTICKKCFIEQNKEYKKQYRQKNKEQIKKYNKKYKKQYYQENKEKIKKCSKEWVQNNKEYAKEIEKQYYQEHKEQIKKYSKEWCNKNKEKRKTIVNKYVKNNPEKIKKNSIKQSYGISLEEYNSYYKSDICPICNKIMKTKALDHCHKTGKIRGFICRKCNSGLGFLYDDKEILLRAIKWLEEEKQIVS